MAWKTLEPPVRQTNKVRAKLGTISRGGVAVRGALSFTGDLLANFTHHANCDVAVDDGARKLRLTFGEEGKFAVIAVGQSRKKGGGRLFLPLADWLPPMQFRAIEISIEKINGDELLLALPAKWPDPPAQAASEE